MTKRKPSDFTLMITVLILVVIGIIMVFSASYAYAYFRLGDGYHFLKRDLLWAVVGLCGMLATMNFDYWRYKKIAPLGFILSLVLLILVLTPLGIEYNGAKRWLGVGGFTVMPSEIAKICSIFFVAASLSNRPEKIKNFLKGVVPYLGIIGLYFGLIILQPNLSTAVTISAIIVSMMFVTGMRWGHLAFMGGGGVGLLVVMILAEPYRMRRLTGFLDPFADARDTGYQVIQSLLALGSGGLFGVGLGKSIQKYLYIPEPQNDFIFAIIGEELGFIGCVAVIILYLLLIWRGVRIAINAPDLFSCLIATGITAMVAVQVIINIAVATSSMPVTGIPLPFISWGGTSLAIFMTAIGVMLNISRYANLDRS
ncbi:cell division protein FtsW [Anaerosolibacter carboniphilus]|uniref:Probable peptidoglycan glycosyltransferase FtsW n=1 Tax=Anaerosolibacter carboniphilus TaxID=1417629 RepID=A0A841KTT8_9FIRM|nr:stage V sporulation protein E [Anaerosolibacter carboniphilus]MBB6217006.1 cell division protein FtsW [Anaerosolibacter carboniphilus]